MTGRISNEHPSTYLFKLVENGVVDDEPELIDIVADHFISPSAFDCMLEDDFDGFIRERQRTLMQHISTLVGAEAPETVMWEYPKSGIRGSRDSILDPQRVDCDHLPLPTASVSAGGATSPVPFWTPKSVIRTI